MPGTVVLSAEQALALVERALIVAGASAANASSVARALVAAEVDGHSGHGLSRTPAYAAQVRSGKVDGQARPALSLAAAAALRIDAGGGFAYPALDAAVAALPELAGACGVAMAAIDRSHHIGQAGLHVERLAASGLVALIVSNTPAAMAFHGATAPRLGTNPLAFAAPIPGREPLVIDMALSQAARSRIVAARKRGEAIPPDWARRPDGRPTTDPEQALKGALQPIGGAKGAALAMMVEVLCGALAGARFGWQASSFLDDQGPPPGVGQVLVAFDPGPVTGASFGGQMAELVRQADADGARLPGDARLQARRRAIAEGLAISAELHEELAALGAPAG